MSDHPVVHTIEVDGMVRTYTMPAETRMERVTKPVPGEDRWWYTTTSWFAGSTEILRVSKKYRVSKRGRTHEERIYVREFASPLVTVTSESVSAFSARRCGKSEVGVRFAGGKEVSARTK